MESRERIEQMMEEQYNKGITVGMELMMEKLRMAAENGTPIEIDGRAWYLKSDIENLRDIFEEEPSGYCAGGSFSYKVAMKSLNLIILSIRY